MASHERDGLREQVTAPIGGASEEVTGPSLGRIGSYRLIRMLGEGGFGSVYLAEQASPKRLVAIKVLKAGAASRQALARFEHEAQTLARLQHPGIAQVLEAGVYDSATGSIAEKSANGQTGKLANGSYAPFFAMEYIQGETLTAYARRVDFKPRQVVGLVIKVCEAVQHAHQHGVIHRDLKPANILVDRSGQPKVLDFGVARVADDDMARVTARTDVGQIIGTLAYMSPEQVAADPAKVDTRADVYALGVILFELLTGRLPYTVEQKLLHEATRTICESEPTRLGTVSRTYKGDLETIAGKALEKDQSRRYQSAAALAEDLRRFLADEPIVARPPSTVYQWQKFAKRNKALVGGIAGVMAALAVGAVAASVQAVRATKAQKLAESETARATAAQKLAEQEAGKAKAVTAFFEETLASADPDKKGKDVRLADVLTEAAGGIDRELTDQPEVAGALNRAVARAYLGLGLLDVAAKQADDAIARLKAAGLGDESPDVLDARSVRAEVYQAQSKFKEAEAENLAIRAAWVTRNSGKETASSLMALGDLSDLYVNSGRPEEAESTQRRVVAGYMELLGKDAAETLAAELFLAQVLDVREKAQESAALLAHVMEVRQRTLAPDDRRLDRVREAMGEHYRLGGQFAKAAEVHGQTVAAFRARYGAEHPRTLSRTNDWGKSLQQAGKLAEAEGVLAPNFEVLKRTMGEEDFLTQTAAGFLGDVYHAQGKLEQSAAMRRFTGEVRARTLGPDHPQTLVAWTNLAFILVDMGQLDEAKTILEDMLERRTRTLGPGHNEVGLTLGLLGFVELKRSDWGAAEGFYRRSLNIREKVLPEGNGVRGLTMNALGHAIAMQGRRVEAEPLLTRGAEWVLADPRSPARNKKDAVERVVQLYEGWGKAEQAAAWREKLPK